MTGDSILGNIATFTCHVAYQLVGSQKRVCAADGQWSGVQPICNGKFITSSVEVYNESRKIKQQILIECNKHWLNISNLVNLRQINTE